MSSSFDQEMRNSTDMLPKSDLRNKFRGLKGLRCRVERERDVVPKKRVR